MTHKERPDAGGDRAEAKAKACTNKDCELPTNKSPKPQTEESTSAAIERRYGALLVIGFSDQRTLKRCLCRCDCGNVVQISVEALTAGQILNCGNCRQAPNTKRHKGGAS